MTVCSRCRTVRNLQQTAQGDLLVTDAPRRRMSVRAEVKSCRSNLSHTDSLLRFRNTQDSSGIAGVSSLPALLILPQ